MNAEALDPVRALAVAYSPATARPGLRALLALDERFARIVREARDPRLGEIKLVWWRDALAGLDAGEPPAEPLLAAAAEELVPELTGAALGAAEPAWRALLTEPPLSDELLALHAEGRGARLFAQGAALCGVAPEAWLRAAGEAWALGELAGRQGETARRASALAAERRAAVAGRRWPRALRGLGALYLADAGGTPTRRLLRLVFHRATGR